MGALSPSATAVYAGGNYPRDLIVDAAGHAYAHLDRLTEVERYNTVGYYFQSGGGTYRRFDMRVNTDYDPRLSGDFDRRVNIDYDRRTTIHIDPRVNY